jgi:hypothetical protein
MNGIPQTAAGLRELQHTLASAKDAHIERVVAIVDAMPERGSADGLIAPLRPRLAQIRPARPLRFSRLLFLPLDPLIVPAPKWRPEYLTIPRTALEPLAGSVRDAMDAELRAAVDRAIAGRTTRDAETIRKAGALLWPAAAASCAPHHRPGPGARPSCRSPSIRRWRAASGPCSRRRPPSVTWPMRPGTDARAAKGRSRRCCAWPRSRVHRRSAA